MKKLIISSSLIAISIILNACASQGDHARSLANESCQFVELPASALVRDGDKITIRGKSYIFQDRYLALMGHAGHLAECASDLSCAAQWTEYERDCQARENKLIRLIFGYKTACSLVKPNC